MFILFLLVHGYLVASRIQRGDDLDLHFDAPINIRKRKKIMNI
jgi:hypothetical protein